MKIKTYKDKKLFVELRWHVPKGEFFLDIELVKEGRRVHCETYGSILHMVHNANCVLSHYGSKSEIKLSQDETHILKMNEPSYAAAHNIVLKQWKNCLAN